MKHSLFTQQPGIRSKIPFPTRLKQHTLYCEKGFSILRQDEEMLQSLAAKEMHTCPPVMSTLMEVGRRKCYKILKGNFIHCMASSKNLPKGMMTTTKATLTSVAEWIESRTFPCGNVPAKA